MPQLARLEWKLVVKQADNEWSSDLPRTRSEQVIRKLVIAMGTLAVASPLIQCVSVLVAQRWIRYPMWWDVWFGLCPLGGLVIAAIGSRGSYRRIGNSRCCSQCWA